MRVPILQTLILKLNEKLNDDLLLMEVLGNCQDGRKGMTFVNLAYSGKIQSGNTVTSNGLKIIFEKLEMRN